MDNLLDDIRKHLDKKSFNCPYYDLFEYPQRALDEDIWKLMPQNEKQAFEKIQQNSDYRLGDLREKIFQGVTTSADKIYYVYLVHDIGSGLVKIRPQKSNKQHTIERDLLKPILKGADVRRWKIKWKNLWMIFPYTITGNHAKLITESEMKSRHPHTWNYFLSNETGLKSRERGRMKDRKDWYGFIYKKNLQRFEQMKILTPSLSNKRNFTLDSEGKYYFVGGTAGVYGITLKQYFRKNIGLYYLLGILNSKTSDFYLKHISQIYSGGYYKYNPFYLEQLPIKLPQTPEEKYLKGQIVERVKMILLQVDPKHLIEDFPEKYLDEYRSRGMEFDEIKYTFNTDHIKLTPILSGQSGGGYVVYPSKQEDPIWVETKEKAQYIMLALRKKSVTQNDTIKILIPRDNSIVTEILETIKKMIKEVESTPTKQLEEEIDELVYQLYGLNERDKAIIESFLKKF